MYHVILSLQVLMLKKIKFKNHTNKNQENAIYNFSIARFVRNHNKQVLIFMKIIFKNKEIYLNKYIKLIKACKRLLILRHLV